MNNRILIALAAAIALWSGTGQGTLKNVENAYESDAAHVQLPSSASGEVLVSECTGCKTVALRVNAQTLYLVGQPPVSVSLDAMRQAASAKGAGTRHIVVFYDMESMLVTRIVMKGGA